MRSIYSASFLTILSMCIFSTPASALIVKTDNPSDLKSYAKNSLIVPLPSSSSSSKLSSNLSVGGPNSTSQNYSQTVTFDYQDSTGKATQTINLNTKTTTVAYENGQIDIYYYYNGSTHTPTLPSSTSSTPVPILDKNNSPATLVQNYNNTATIYHSDNSTSTVNFTSKNNKISLNTSSAVTFPSGNTTSSLPQNTPNSIIVPSNVINYTRNTNAAPSVNTYYDQYTKDAAKHQHGTFDYMGTTVYDFSEAGTLSNCSVFGTVWVNSQGTKQKINQVNGSEVVRAMTSAGYRTTLNNQYSLNDIKVGDVISYSGSVSSSSGRSIGNSNHVAVISDIVYNSDGSIAKVTTANARTHGAAAKGATYKETYTGDDLKRLYNAGALNVGCVE